MIFVIVLAILFISPAYFQFKAKGYSPALFITPAILIAAIGSIGSGIHYAAFWLLMIAPPGLFVISLFLKPKTRPSEDEMETELTCPECHKPISLDRTREQMAQPCPECGMLIVLEPIVQADET